MPILSTSIVYSGVRVSEPHLCGRR